MPVHIARTSLSLRLPAQLSCCAVLTLLLACS